MAEHVWTPPREEDLRWLEDAVARAKDVVRRARETRSKSMETRLRVQDQRHARRDALAGSFGLRRFPLE